MTDEILRSIAAHGLQGAADGPIDVAVDLWPTVLHRLEQERLTGVAAALFRDGVLRLEDEAAQSLAELDSRWAAHTLRAEDVMLDLARALQERAIDFRVLKGSAIAELGWTVGEARRWVDADVLVPADRMEEVVALCVEAGATRPVSQLRRGYDRRFAKSVTLRSSAGPEIDVHRALVLGPHTFLIPVQDLFDRPRSFAVDDVQMKTLSAEATLVHVCLHATVAGARRLAILRDIVESFAGADPEAAMRLATRWQARPMVRDAGRAVARQLDLADHPFVTWSKTVVPSPSETRVASVYRADVRNNRNLALASLRHVPGVLGKVRFAWAMLVPAADNRSDRQRSRLDQLRRLRGR